VNSHNKDRIFKGEEVHAHNVKSRLRQPSVEKSRSDNNEKSRIRTASTEKMKGEDKKSNIRRGASPATPIIGGKGPSQRITSNRTPDKNNTSISKQTAATSSRGLRIDRPTHSSSARGETKGEDDKNEKHRALHSGNMHVSSKLRNEREPFRNLEQKNPKVPPSYTIGTSSSSTTPAVVAVEKSDKKAEAIPSSENSPSLENIYNIHPDDITLEMARKKAFDVQKQLRNITSFPNNKNENSSEYVPDEGDKENGYQKIIDTNMIDSMQNTGYTTTLSSDNTTMINSMQNTGYTTTLSSDMHPGDITLEMVRKKALVTKSVLQSYQNDSQTLETRTCALGEDKRGVPKNENVEHCFTILSPPRSVSPKCYTKLSATGWKEENHQEGGNYLRPESHPDILNQSTESVSICHGSPRIHIPDSIKEEKDCGTPQKFIKPYGGGIDRRSTSSLTTGISQSVTSFHEEVFVPEKDNVKTGRLEYEYDPFRSGGMASKMLIPEKKYNPEVEAKMSMFEVELEDKRAIIAKMRDTITQLKADRDAVETSTRLIWEGKMSKIKTESETVCERQLGIVNKLMKEKSELTQKCMELAEGQEKLRTQGDKKFHEISDTHQKEMKNLKSNLSAQEKMRRDQWEKEKTKEIKEMTIKGMEPEVQKILNERKQERRRLEEQYAEQIENLRTELNTATATKVRETREMMVLQNEQAVDAEREKCQRRLQEEREKIDKLLADERKKCAESIVQNERMHADDKVRCAQENAEKIKKVLEEAEDIAQKRTKILSDKIMEDEKRHQEEKDELKKQINNVRLELEKEYQNKLALQRVEVEKELVEKLTVERDNQIKILIGKLSQENFEREQTLLKKRDATNADLMKEHKRELRIKEEEIQTMVSEKEKMEKQCAQEKSEKESLLKDLTGEMVKRQEYETKVLNAEKSIQEAQSALENMKKQTLLFHRENTEKATEERERTLREIEKTYSMRETEWKKKEEEAQTKLNHEQEKVQQAHRSLRNHLQVKDNEIEKLKEQIKVANCKVEEYVYLLQRQREELLGNLAT